jgi:hypothetical protein
MMRRRSSSSNSSVDTCDRVLALVGRSAYPYDGQRWTQHFAPTPPPNAPAPPAVAVASSSGVGANHALHAVLTFLSCGLWLPVGIWRNAPGHTVTARGRGGGELPYVRPTCLMRHR